MMQGLFDFLNTPAGQGLLATGLGAAASYGQGRGLLGNLGAGGLAGMRAYTGAQDRQAQMAQDAKRNELYDMQVKAYQADVERKNAALDAERRKREALPGLYRAAGMTGGEAAPQTMGGIPMFSQPMGVTPMSATPGGFDVMGALKAGYSPEEIEKLATINNVGRPKATRQMEVDDGKGGKRIALVDDYGNEVAGFAGYTAPVQVNQGDRVSFVRPSAGVSLPVGMSPGERDASARGWANVNLTKAQLEQGKTQVMNDPNQGPMLVNKVTGTATPIRGADGAAIPSEAQAKQVSGSRKALAILDEADKLIDSATGSYLGAGVDQVGRFFGSTTPGAAATAKLKALEGSLMMAQPRMEGPQSNLDVQLYRQMAGQIGDPTIPSETKKAAIATVRELHEKYAGAKPEQPQRHAGTSPRVQPGTMDTGAPTIDDLLKKYGR